MIPPFEPHSGNLPPGLHHATWEEVVTRFGGNAHRRQLLDGLRVVLELLHQFGCQQFYLDGSFVTAKELPGDWDGRWDVEGVDVFRLLAVAPLLWDGAPGRPNQKAQYGGDIFPIRLTASRAERRVLDQFQVVYATGQAKGIIVLDLETL